MIKVYIKKQSNYPVRTPKLKSKLRDFLKKKGIVSDSFVNLSLVGERKMKQISKKFLNEEGIHDVLTFVEGETKKGFVSPPGNFNYLGEIVVCYPQAVEEAKKERRLIEDKVYQLVEHGAKHLLGEHHE